MEKAWTSTLVPGMPPDARRLLIGLALITAAAFAIGLAFSRDHLAHDLLWSVSALGALAICALRPLLVAQDRLIWGAISAGVALRITGELLAVGSTSAPELSDADLWVSLSGLLPLYVGIGTLVSRQLSEPSSSFWLDGMIAALAIAAVVGAFLVQPLADAGPAAAVCIALALAAPLGDVVLLSMVGGLFLLNRWKLGAMWGALTIALLASLCGGAAAVAEIAISGELSSVVPAAFSGFALIAFAAAAWHRPSPRQPPQRGTVIELTVPALVLVASTTVLAWDHFDPIGTVPVILAVAALAAVMVRGMWTLRDLRSLAAMRREALTDDLTGLPNRRALYRSLETSTAIGSATDRRIALLLFDLDRFKDVNDALGHDVGDRLLGLVAERLRAATRSEDIVARIGGDEFALVCATDSEQETMQVAERLGFAFAQPYDLNGAEIHVEVSVGVAIFPDHADGFSSLLRRADLAKHYAKKTRSGRAMFSAERDESGLDRLGLVSEIERALERGHLEAFYQPQIDLRTGELIGAEALIRWRHPDRGVLGPGEFLPVIQQTGLMRRITQLMLAGAVRQAAEWWHAGRPLRISVNLSPIDLLDGRLPDDLAALLREHELPPEWLTIEITEDTAVQDLQRGLDTLIRFRSLGVGVSLDDFGTGHSSLAHLKGMPVDELKIDRSFLRDYPGDLRDAALVTAAVDLAHTLGLRVVAEGVESNAAIEALLQTSCDVVQGFLVSRPLSSHSFDLWMDGWSPSRLAGGSVGTDEA